MSKDFTLEEINKTKLKDFSKEAQNGIKMFRRWIKKISIDNLENDCLGFILKNECATDHSEDEKINCRSKYCPFAGCEDRTYFDCCAYDLSNIVVVLCIYSGASIKEAHRVAKFLRIKQNFYRSDVEEGIYPD